MTIEEEFLNNVVEDKIKSKPRKKGINAKKKGNRGELECYKIFNERFKDLEASFHRSPSSGAFVGGKNSYRKEELNEEQNLLFVGDIYCNKKTFKFTIEHKAYTDEKADIWQMFNESSDLHSWMKQANNDAASVNKEPMLIVKYNNHKRIVFVNMSYLIEQKSPIKPVFIHNNKGCFWLEDLLNLPNSFFFNEEA